MLCTFTLLLLATLDLSECLLRGYTNSRSWGTGRQGRVEDSRRTSRMGRRLTLPACRICEAEDTSTGLPSDCSHCRAVLFPKIPIITLSEVMRCSTPSRLETDRSNVS